MTPGPFVGLEHHVVAEPTDCRGPRGRSGPASPRARRPRRPAPGRTRRRRRSAHLAARPVRRRSGRAAAGCCAASDFGGPDQRAESTPGIPLSASTQRPESSATVGSPVAASPARALSSALPSKVGWSSTGSSYVGTSSSPSTSTLGEVLGEDPLHLGELLGVARGQEDACVTGGQQRLLLQPGQVGAALLAEREQRVELGARERGALGGALHLDERAGAGHHDVHVGLGADVLLVGEVQARRRRR